MNVRKALRPFYTIFIIINTLALLLNKQLKSAGVDADVLLIGNVFVFALTGVSFYMLNKGINAKTTFNFMSAVYGSFMMKLVVGAAAVVVYVLYAGEQKNANDNMNLLLKNLADFENKNARFVTVIALIINGNEYLFEGELIGKINDTKSGNFGFGYDPIFVPNGFNISLAEMDLQEKNKISHRAKAFEKMIAFLTTYNQ